MAGCLPNTYPEFLQELGHTKANANRIKQKISHNLRDHLKTMLTTYWRITTKPTELKEKRNMNRHHNEDSQPTQNNALDPPPPIPPPCGSQGAFVPMSTSPLRGG